MNRMLIALALLLVSSVAGALTTNHSLNIIELQATPTQVYFLAEATQPSSLNIPMQAAVCPTDNSSIILGNTNTFTSVGQRLAFTVDISAGGYSNGDQILVHLSDFIASAACNNGFEGFIDQYRIGTFAVPALGAWGAGVLVLMVAGIPLLRRRRVSA